MGVAEILARIDHDIVQLQRARALLSVGTAPAPKKVIGELKKAAGELKKAVGELKKASGKLKKVAAAPKKAAPVVPVDKKAVKKKSKLSLERPKRIAKTAKKATATKRPPAPRTNLGRSRPSSPLDQPTALVSSSDQSGG